MIENPVTYLLNNLMQAAPALLVLLGGVWLARTIQRRLGRWLTHLSAIDEPEALLIARVAFWIVLLIAALIALALLGFNLQGIVTFLSLLAVVLVIAFQQSLNSFAATVIFYVFRVVRPGDYIEAMGHEGTVQELHLFHSTVLRPDGKLVSLPHNRMLDLGIVNRTRAGTVRAEVTFELAHSADLDRVRETLLEWLKSNPRVQGNPLPEVVVVDVTVGAIRLAARAAVDWHEVGSLQTELREQVALAVTERQRIANG
jgi:small conductance mechanosensitive channel